MESFRIATLTQPFRRHRLSRRAALASAGAGLATALLGRVGLSPRTAWPRTPLPRRRPPGRQPAAERPGLDADPGRSGLGLRRAGPGRGERGPPGARPGRQLLARWPICTARSRPMPSSTRSTTAASRPSTRASTGLLVHGLVERPTLFTMDDLKRFPSVSVVHFLECSGNSFSEWTEASMGQTVQLSHGLTSCAEWTGVPVATILREVGIKPGGGWMLAEGADAGGARPQHPGRQGDGRRVARLRRQRRGPAPLPGLSRCACCCPASRATPTSSGCAA